MIRNVSPQEAEALISRGDLDVVDVRELREFSQGHVPRARPVSLAEIKANARAVLPRDGVIFVCAKGVRSLAAAKAAEAVGLAQLYSIDGGTAGWTRAGLGLVR